MAHGYGLGGSGSNLWTREVVRALCREGHEVHLLCQESRPERLDFVSEAWGWDPTEGRRVLFRRSEDDESPFPGRCVVHRPDLEVLPTYVRPQEPSEYVHSILDLDDTRLDGYVRRNEEVILSVAEEHGIEAFHVNHVLLLSEAFRRARARGGPRYAVLPHGSALEYVVRKDPRMRETAASALRAAHRILLLNGDVGRRLREVFPDLDFSDQRTRTVRAGVDTDRFRVVPRGERDEASGDVTAALSGVPRGRDPEATRRLLADVDGVADGTDAPAGDADGDDDGLFEALRDAFRRAADHPRGRPDEDAEERLARVPWGEAPVVLYVGRFVGGKGVPSVVTAFPRILERHPGARLLMVGAGPLREPLEALVHALGSGRHDLARAILRDGDAVDPDGYPAFEASRSRLAELEEAGELADWFEAARGLDADRVVFTGYLEHDVLSRIFPLTDVAVFPSVVAEASPLVVAEAAASGCVPVGTDFAGMARTLDAIGSGLDPDVRALMRVRPESEHVVADIEDRVIGLLDRLGPSDGEADRIRHRLREVAVERFDWRSIGADLVAALQGLAEAPEPADASAPAG